MERLRLALDIDNYPELIVLDNVFQEVIENPAGKKAHTGKAVVMMDLEVFRNLFEVAQETKLINLKTGKVIKDAGIFVDNETLDVIYCVPKRTYTKIPRPTRGPF